MCARTAATGAPPIAMPLRCHLSRSLVALAACALLVSGAPLTPTALAQATAAPRLPALGDAAAEALPVASERRIGEQIMREVRRDPAYLDDPLLLDYLQSLWTPLLAAARARGDIGADTDAAFAWEVFAVRDRTVNAFALPGGYIGLHLGLIAMTALRDELASVLAHELAHVTQRHIALRVAGAQRTTLVGMAAIVLGVLAASRAGSADAAQAAIVGGQAAMIQQQLGFSREMEREADRIGWAIFLDAGFEPAGKALMFERLLQASRLVDDGSFPYLRTHPLTVERIGEARALLEALPPRPRAPAVNVFEHPLMQARARVLMDAGVPALRRVQALQPPADATAPERLAVLYGRALAALKLREPDAAAQALAQARALLAANPLRDAHDARSERVLRLLEAEVRSARGDAAGAVALLDGAAAATPGSGTGARPLLLQRAQSALVAHREGAPPALLRASVEALQVWVAEHRADAGAWSLLAQGAAQLGLPLRAVRAEAETQAALGDLRGAIDRLRAGQRLAGDGGSADFVERSAIDARLRELQLEQRAREAEARRGG